MSSRMFAKTSPALGYPHDARPFPAESFATNGLGDFFNEVDAWQRAAALRAYVQARHAAHSAAAGVDPDGLFNEWRWALMQADQMDPLSTENFRGNVQARF